MTDPGDRTWPADQRHRRFRLEITKRQG